MHLHWQGWQHLLYKAHCDFEAYFKGKKCVLYTRKYGIKQYINIYMT